MKVSVLTAPPIRYVCFPSHKYYYCLVVNNVKYEHGLRCGVSPPKFDYFFCKQSHRKIYSNTNAQRKCAPNRPLYIFHRFAIGAVNNCSSYL